VTREPKRWDVSTAMTWSWRALWRRAGWSDLVTFLSVSTVGGPCGKCPYSLGLSHLSQRTVLGGNSCRSTPPILHSLINLKVSETSETVRQWPM
jgi:hypothetical protein